MRKRDQGYVLIGVLILLALSAIIVSSSLKSSASSSRTILSGKIREREYYNAEETLSRAATWLRTQSTSLVSMYSRSNFYSKFDRSTPSYGSNDTSVFKIPTKIKMQGTNNSVILTNTSALATGAFPTSTDTITGNAFNALTSFPTASLGSNNVRITLVDAPAIVPASDFGDTDAGNTAPVTDFFPIYRVDALKSLNDGGHVFGYLYGNLVFDYGIGFFGKDFFEMRQTCDSYLSNGGAYTAARKRANCPTGSHGPISIHQSELLYGSARTKGGITTSSPWGGPVCSDFTPGCPNRGPTCTGSSCNVPGLPTYSPWATYCPGTVQTGSYSTQTLTLPGSVVSPPTAAQRCWSSFTVANNQTVTLTSTHAGYYFKNLDVRGTLQFKPNPSNGTINIYVERFNNDKVNGNQIYNIVDANNDGIPDYKPYQLRIHYLGTYDLTLNGNAKMQTFMNAPYANVSIQGSFDYFGGLKAKGLTMTGSGDVHYDESGDITTISDIQYQIRNIEQYAR